MALAQDLPYKRAKLVVAYTFERIYGSIDEAHSHCATDLRRTVYQTDAWGRFLAATQQGEQVIGRLKDGQRTIGLFVGLIVRKFGLRILGSPFPGWSTDYMGMILSPETDRHRALEALIEFAFHDLSCVHLEIMDRRMTEEELHGLDVQYRVYRSFEIDLTREEDELFANMTSACRRCIRKAAKNGVTVEEADDLQFADEYFSQLVDVFDKQSLVPTYGVDRVRQLIAHIKPTGNLLLLRARDQHGRCIATGIFPHGNGVMYFWGGASWREYQSLRPNEALHWYSMKRAKRTGLRLYDMGGAGEYKRKYGGYEIEVPWLRKSRFAWVGHMRNVARRFHTIRRQSLGQLNALHALEPGS
jgi:hypothetical protein